MIDAPSENTAGSRGGAASGARTVTAITHGYYSSGSAVTVAAAARSYSNLRPLTALWLSLVVLTDDLIYYTVQYQPCTEVPSESKSLAQRNRLSQLGLLSGARNTVVPLSRHITGTDHAVPCSAPQSRQWTSTCINSNLLTPVLPP